MAVNQADVVYVRDLVKRRSAIVLDSAKDYLIETRLDKLSRDMGCRDISELVSKAKADAKVDTRIVEAITTHETSFFRDFSPFEALRKVVIPDLIKSKRSERSITIWSAACSGGQEPYSISLLLKESFPELATWNVRIVATDLSAQILEKAKQGKFSQLEVNRGLPASMLTRYFERSGAFWEISPEIKRMVDFRLLNLIEPWVMMPKPDIVFIRNVLIYFDVETKKMIMERVAKNIARSGFLFLGSAETTLNIAEGWSRYEAEKSIYYRIQS